jgi:hypothetical protein
MAQQRTAVDLTRQMVSETEEAMDLEADVMARISIHTYRATAPTVEAGTGKVEIEIPTEEEMREMIAGMIEEIMVTATAQEVVLLAEIMVGNASGREILRTETGTYTGHASLFMATW